MSWTSWFSSDDDGSDNSWWGYAMAAASEYADSEGKKKDKKKDFENQLKLLRERYALEDQYKQIEGQRLADSYKGYAQYNQPTDATSGNPTNPMQAFSNQPQGLLNYGRYGR